MTHDEALIAALFAVDPSGLGGVVLRGPAGAHRDEWLDFLRQLLPPNAPVRRIPSHINDTALLGGLDVGASLHLCKPVPQAGTLERAHGGLVVIAMAERLSPGTAAKICAVVDSGSVQAQREGLAPPCTTTFGVVALDEGVSDSERVPAAIRDRLAFHLVLRGDISGEDAIEWQPQDVVQARELLPDISTTDTTLHALCAAAAALGIDSLRAPLLALRVARTAAALSGSQQVEEEHVALAARWVLAPRATRLPASESESPESESDLPEESPEAPAQRAEQGLVNAQQESAPKDTPPATANHAEDTLAQSDSPDSPQTQALVESVLQAARASIPADLLTALQTPKGNARRAMAAGRSGVSMASKTRGRPLGARRGDPRSGARLNVMETLRAAAPWQKLRMRESQDIAVLPVSGGRPRIQVRREDLHVTRYKQVSQTTTVFIVDASGSAALHRLAETKGAVELLLADCYVRRDHVAVLAFRGKAAEVLLAPTRSLARAKRSLAGLPGGGGTPLAAGLQAAHVLSNQILRRGETPVLVVLTDGRANIALDGSPGRARANEDAKRVARQLKGTPLMSLVLDTAAQPDAHARDLAQTMGATYLPLPYAGARAMSSAVKAVVAGVQH